MGLPGRSAPSRHPSTPPRAQENDKGLGSHHATRKRKRVQSNADEAPRVSSPRCAGSQTMDSPTSSWTCENCDLENPSSGNHCELCDAPRTGSRSGAREAQPSERNQRNMDKSLAATDTVLCLDSPTKSVEAVLDNVFEDNPGGAATESSLVESLCSSASAIKFSSDCQKMEVISPKQSVRSNTSIKPAFSPREASTTATSIQRSSAAQAVDPAPARSSGSTDSAPVQEGRTTRSGRKRPERMRPSQKQPCKLEPRPPSRNAHVAPSSFADAPEILYNPPPLTSAQEVVEESEEEEAHSQMCQGESTKELGTASSDSEGDEAILQQHDMEDADCFDDTDDDEEATRKSSSSTLCSVPEPEEVQLGEPEIVKVQRHRKPNLGMPRSVTYSYVDEGWREPRRKALPAVWPHPREKEYAAFMRSFFRGEAAGHASHDWKWELAQCEAVQAGRESAQSEHCLSPWQAAGYLHAQKVLRSADMRGCLFWWTPGSGKSVMVALLLELLLDEPHEVFVVSTPQNTRENGYDECMRSLLAFSPLLATSTPGDPVALKALVSRMRRRRVPLLKTKHFLSFRQFENEMRARLAKGGVQNAAVIVDECHELFNGRLCDQHAMWEGERGVLRQLAEGKGNKLFLLSGTPWRDHLELQRLINLVRGRGSRTSAAWGLRQGSAPEEEMEERVRFWSLGHVSFVDGAMDRSNFPDNGGWRVEECAMQPAQVHNFAGRCRPQLQSLGCHNLCELAASLAHPEENVRRAAVRAMRLVQVAGGVFWGSESRSGLGKLLQSAETATLQSVERLAPKFARLCRNILHPRAASGEELEPLSTRHFVYSASDSTITALSRTLYALHGEQRRFKQLHAADLEWVDPAQTQIRLRSGALGPAHQDSIAFVVIRGTVAETKKLKAAFGFVTPDGRRFEGLRRSSGVPLVQVLLGSHETNQGLTFLRLQRIHLMEPNPLGWGKVLQTIGRGIRRGTHCLSAHDALSAADAALPSFRRVETIIYAAVLDQPWADRERAAQIKELEERIESTRAAYRAGCSEVRTALRMRRCAADASEAFEAKIEKRVAKERKAMGKLVDECASLVSSKHKVEEGWLMVDIPGSWSKKRGAVRRALVPTWRMLPDEAVLQVTWQQQHSRQRLDEVVSAAAVDAAVLQDMHARRAPATPPSPALATRFEQARLQHTPCKRPEPTVERLEDGAVCVVCLAEAEWGRRCAEGHAECAACSRTLRPSTALPASGFACEQEACAGFCSAEDKQERQFPPYWSHRDEEGVRLVRLRHRDAAERINALIHASVRPECRAPDAACRHSDVAAWGSIAKVVRIENGPLWQRYSERKVELLQEAAGAGAGERLAAQTEGWQAVFEEVALRADVNELFLFHGTSEQTATTIAAEGFDLRYANPNGFYGGGIYAADSACKSMSYARSHGSGSRVLLLCRVTMGARPFRTDRDHQGQTAAPAGFDSLFAEHGIARQGAQFHNEFVLFHAAQILPEYLVYFS